jgi:hypothetical protein
VGGGGVEGGGGVSRVQILPPAVARVQVQTPLRLYLDETVGGVGTQASSLRLNLDEACSRTVFFLHKCRIN